MELKNGKFVEDTNHIVIYNFGKGGINLDDSGLSMLTIRDYILDRLENGNTSYRVESSYKNGKKNGEETIYRKFYPIYKWEKYISINYKNGVIDGEYSIYEQREEGSIFTAEFEDGSPIRYSIYREYATQDEDHNRYTASKEVESGHFKDGIINGKSELWGEYNDDGFGPYSFICGEVNYKNGKKHGKEIHFTPDKLVTYEVNYVNGKKEGLEIYYRGKQIEKELKYINGQNVYRIDYRENGNISRKFENKGNYKETSFYYENGNLEELRRVEEKTGLGEIEYYDENGYLINKKSFNLNNEPSRPF